MASRVRVDDVRVEAEKHGLILHRECGGFRLVRESDGGRRDVYPDGGVCRVVPVRELQTFLAGMAEGMRPVKGTTWGGIK